MRLNLTFLLIVILCTTACKKDSAISENDPNANLPISTVSQTSATDTITWYLKSDGHCDSIRNTYLLSGNRVMSVIKNIWDTNSRISKQTNYDIENGAMKETSSIQYEYDKGTGLLSKVYRYNNGQYTGFDTLFYQGNRLNKLMRAKKIQDTSTVYTEISEYDWSGDNLIEQRRLNYVRQGTATSLTNKYKYTFEAGTNPLFLKTGLSGINDGGSLSQNMISKQVEEDAKGNTVVNLDYNRTYNKRGYPVQEMLKYTDYNGNVITATYNYTYTYRPY
ncbi:hypothetical protein [Chitinophaga vietnamensis]|uniref:hypothetical protein n=1 Tax=Chitinophaga vietnamensis TaxID=2593957 RepID=UPI0011783256|nr:hypothetical protein [Chitinophaga vietnamensis]